MAAQDYLTDSTTVGLEGASARSCGDCTVCCTLCYVPEFDKGEGIKCKHCDKGCMIYKDRPVSCRKYECAWRKGELPDHMRPDKCGVMVEVYPLMVAAMLAPGYALQALSNKTLSVLDEYVKVGKPVIATGKFVRLPEGMTSQEANSRLIETVKKYKHGTGKLHN